MEFLRLEDEELPKVITGPKEENRFEEAKIDIFWMSFNWMVGIIITLMGFVVLRDMIVSYYSPVAAICWSITSVFSLGVLVLIDKYHNQ